MYTKMLLSHPIFFGQRAHWKLGKVVVIFSVIPTFSCSAERALSVLRCPKTDQKFLYLCSERVYVNRVDIEKMINEFSSSKKVRSKFFFLPIFIRSKGDLSLTY